MTIGLDTNVLCYALDPAYPEHRAVENLLIDLSPENTIALNPTILHETYHTLVFSLRWLPEEAAKRLAMLLQHPYIEFYNQTKNTVHVALKLASKHDLGGRDSLIAANFLSNKVPVVLTHDQELLALHELSWKNQRLTFKDPVSNIAHTAGSKA